MELKSFSSYVKNIQEHFVVWGIILISIIPYLILNVGSLQDISGWFLPIKLNELWQSLNLWRIWTPTFVHYTILHLLVNLYLWWLFASTIESESRFELIFITLLSAASANLSQWYFVGPNFGGLSGVIYALMSYRLVLARYGDKKNYSVDKGLVILMLLLIPLAATGMIGKFANYAHIGGLLSGLALAYIYFLFFRTQNN